MPATLRARMEAQAALTSRRQRLRGAIERDAADLQRAAAQRRQRVQMAYRAWGDRESERALDPYGLVYYDGRWFVAGYCHLRRELRTFRLDRVQRAELCEQRFERPAEFDPLAFVIASLANAPGAWLIEVLLETTIDVARERVPAAMATPEQQPDGVLMRYQAENLAWSAHFLAGLGLRFTVRQPAELRAGQLRELAAELAEIAARE